MKGPVKDERAQVHKHARRNATVSASMRFSYPRRYFVNASELTRLARDNEALSQRPTSELARDNEGSISRKFSSPF